MSRIGKKPVKIENGIEIKINGSVISAKKNDLVRELETYNRVNIELKDNYVFFLKKDNTKMSSAFVGTYRSLFANIILGLDKGFKKSLEINGVGYRANINNNNLILQLGYSHDIIFEIPKDINITINKNIIDISGVDKYLVGQVAAKIRNFRPPEPYKGKGVKYSDEIIIRKSGKTSGK